MSTSRLPSTSVISLSAQTFIPTGVALSWEISNLVPTVLWPGSRWGAMDFQAASSIRAHMKGVPNTGSAPEQAA